MIAPIDSATYVIENGHVVAKAWRNGEIAFYPGEPEPYCFLPSKWEVESRGRVEYTDWRTLDTLESVKKYIFPTPDGVKGFRMAVETNGGRQTYEADKKWLDNWRRENKVICSDYTNQASWDSEQDDVGEPPNAETANKPIIGFGVTYHGQTESWVSKTDELGNFLGFIDFLIQNKITLLKGHNSRAWDTPYFGRRLAYLLRKADPEVHKLAQFDMRSIRFLDNGLMYKFTEKNYKSQWSLEKIAKRLLDKTPKPFPNRRIGTLPDVEIKERVEWDAATTEEYDVLKGYTKLAIQMARMTNLFPDEILGVNPKNGNLTATPGLDQMFFKQAHKVGYVLPNKSKYDKAKYKGAWCYVTRAGEYQNVIQMDFNSLYPNVMKAFKIAPYDRFDFWFPVIDELLAGKTNATDKSEQWAYKIYVNAMYGIQASTHYRFKCADKALATTSGGQEVTRAVADYMTSLGYSVYKGDTDSCFIQAVTYEDRETISKLINEFVEQRFGVTNIKMNFESFWTQIFFPRGAAKEENKKKYYGIVGINKKGQTVNKFEYTGMEILRGDWSDLSKDVQDHGMMMNISHAEQKDKDAYTKSIVDGTLAGAFDNKLVLEKGMTRKPEEYGKPKVGKNGKMRRGSVPQHVKAFRDALLTGWVPSEMIHYNKVQYMMAIGEQPKLVNMIRPEQIDRRWYLHHQVYPILYRLGFIKEMPREPRMKMTEGQGTLDS